MNEQLQEIRVLMDKAKKLPLLMKTPMIENIADKQYFLMEQMILKIEDLENGK